RDFKPDNVLIDARGHVYVADFGLASGMESGAPETGVSPPAGEGAAGTVKVVVGTPAYMSPEQLRGNADASSDIWAFCVSLYEALYGERPFAGREYRDVEESISKWEIPEPPNGARVPG